MLRDRGQGDLLPDLWLVSEAVSPRMLQFHTYLQWKHNNVLPTAVGKGAVLIPTGAEGAALK